MPIGKDSITKRVAKPQVAPEAKAATPETKVAATKAPAKKTTSTTAKKTSATTTAKKASTTTAAKKPAAKKPATEKKVETAVLANVAPETVAAVTGHEENKGFEKVQVGEKMPVHLL